MTDGMNPSPTEAIHSYKQQARRLREALSAEGRRLSHGEALELVARQHGFRDWNTLSAAEAKRPAGANAAPAFTVGSRITGRYLDQPFTGTIRAVTALPDGEHLRLAIHFDEPVDVVTFDSFSAFRQRVHATVNSRGLSPQRTSNGIPHLVISH